MKVEIMVDFDGTSYFTNQFEWFYPVLPKKGDTIFINKLTDFGVKLDTDNENEYEYFIENAVVFTHKHFCNDENLKPIIRLCYKLKIYEQKKVYINLVEFADKLAITTDLLRKKIKNGLIPEYLIFEKNRNNILFYKQKVLNWILNSRPVKQI